MPTYEYECKTCGYFFEKMQSMKEDPLKVCPACGKEVRRLIGGGLGIIFKGSGFYTTDYKRSAANTSSSTEKDNNKSATEKQGEKKSENKPDTKPESKGEVKSEQKKEPVKA